MSRMDTRKRARSSHAAEGDQKLLPRKKARLDEPIAGSPSGASKVRSVVGTKPAKAPQADTPAYGLHESDKRQAAQTTPLKESRPSPATRISRSVYDVPESDDELSTPAVEKARSANYSGAQSSTNGSTEKRRGRPRKTVDNNGYELSRDGLARSMTNGSAAPAAPAPKRRGRPKIAVENEISKAAQDEVTPATTRSAEKLANGSISARRGMSINVTETHASEPSLDTPTPPAKRAKKPSIWEIRRAGTRGQSLSALLNGSMPLAPDQTEPQTTISDSTPHGRGRHADMKPEGGTPKLKGILTPSRKEGTGRTRKSVAFDSGENKGQEVFFEDLPSKSTGKKAVKSPKELPKAAMPEVTAEQQRVETVSDNPEQEGEDEEADDEVCLICKKPDSRPPNEIIFCDGCDMAVHQRCYDVPTIPDGDWLCRNCAQDDALTFSQKDDAAGFPIHVRKEDPVPDIPDFEQHLRAMQRILINRCTGRRRLPLQGQDEAYEKAFQLVEQTVLAGEGNSMLVIGARGSGKTTLVESIVSALSTEHKDEFHVVRLNGFIHTDDKIALKEIWRQLGKEMDVEDDIINRTNNYADTLASLLAVLSHPSEIVNTQQGVTSKSVIFIIDEFDLFATHARQTLLYNLFDIAQARKAPIAVLGLSTRIDVVESLEKRVKSRFSHRYVYLSLPQSLPAFWNICRHGLTVDADHHLRDEGIDASQNGFAEFLCWWNQRVEALHKDPGFQHHLEYHFHSTKSVSAFLTTCILPLSSLSPTSLSLKSHFTNVATRTALDAPDSKLHLLASLSDLDLSMLIAAARLDIVAHTDTVNFAMAYDEYTSLMGRQRVQSASSGMLALGGGARVWGRGVAGVSWERLVSLGLLVPAGLAGRGGSVVGGLEGKMWKVDVALEEIPGYVKLNQVLTRWCREI